MALVVGNVELVLDDLAEGKANPAHATKAQGFGPMSHLVGHKAHPIGVELGTMIESGSRAVRF